MSMDTTFYKYLNKYNTPRYSLDIFKESISYELLSKNQSRNRCINNVERFLKRYPGILTILPDEMINSRKLKQFLAVNYDDVYFDKDIFLNVWMEYYDWKLNYIGNESPGR